MSAIKKISQALFEQTVDKFKKAHAASDKLVMDRDAELEPLQQQIAAILKKYDGKIDTHRKAIEEHKTIMQAYCEQNKAVLFAGDVRSMDMGGFSLGFRLSPYKVVMPEDKKEQKGILALVKKWLPSFLRVKEEINKAALVAAREDKQVQKALPKIGISIEQEDAFFIELHQP